MNIPRMSACVLITVVITAAIAHAQVYVNPNGDDANLGAQSSPVRTISHAIEIALAQMSGPDRESNDEIVLQAGTYRLTAPIVIHAGPKNHTLIIRSSAAIISGAVRVTGWHADASHPGLWVANAPDTLKNTRQLYVDGIRAVRARGNLPAALKQTENGYEAASSEMATWKNPGDIEFVYTGGNSVWGARSSGLGPWTEPRIPVASISGNTITMAQPAWDNSTKRVMLPPGKFKRAANLVGPATVGKEPVHLENAFELLDQPGEWYFDRTAHLIYYMPRPGEDLTKADVEAPILEKLLDIEGTPENPVHNVTFDGIQFAYATWLAPSSPEGFSEIQANYCVTGKNGYAKQGLGDLVPGGEKPFGAWSKTPGNLRVSYAHHITFTNSAFIHLGGAGLDFEYGTRENLVQGCVFTDISGNGLELGGIDQPEASAADQTSDNKVLNNHFYDVPVEFHGGVAIDVGYAANNLIAHNQIDHVPYSGISLGWGGWLDKIEQPGVANYSHDNTVSNNLIFKHMLLLADGGGIYTQGLTGPDLAHGEKLLGNVIHDQFGTGHGIYTDNGCCNVIANDNVLFHTNYDNWGGRHRNYYNGNAGKVNDDFHFEGNYWQQGDPDSSVANVTLKNNHLIASLDDTPKQNLDAAGIEPAYRAILEKRFGKAEALPDTAATEKDYDGLLQKQYNSPAPPDAPSRIGVRTGPDFALLSWNPPTREGGSPVTSYTVTASTGEKVSISEEDFWKFGYVKLPNLKSAGKISFTVTASNAVGESSPSLPSLAVALNPAAIKQPGAPAAVTARIENGIASIHFQTPESDGGSPITAYIFTAEPGHHTTMLTGHNVITLGGKHTTFGTLNGLDGNSAYTIQVSAVNAAGEGEKATAKQRGDAKEQP